MSRVAIREWTSNRLSAAISAAAPTATHGPPPAARTNANIPRIASEPSRMLGSRHANGPSPNSSIAPATITLASWGCSEFGSSPAGVPRVMGPAAAGLIPAITRAALT